MENINVDFTNQDEVRGYIKGLKVCRFMINIGTAISRKRGEHFDPVAPIERAIEELELNVPNKR